MSRHLQRNAVRATRNTIFFIAACATFHWAIAQSVALSGVLGSKALLVVNGTTPKTLSAGDTHMGVKLLNVSGEQATIDINGQRSTVRVGDAPVSIGARRDTTSSNKIVLPLASGGHFFAQGTVNGKPIQFMVDTGATTVALGAEDAKRMGIDYQKGRPVRMGTANGTAQGWLVKLSSVKIGDVEVFEVDAIVGPNMPYALLGNSFLSRFSMNRTSDQMVLERRY
jgi:aspartyl protease family protein